MKVKNIMFSGFMAVVLAGVCGAASAAEMTGDALVVASKGYVDAKVTTLTSKDTELSGKITALENANKEGGDVAKAIAAAQGAADAAQLDVDTLAGKMDLADSNSDLSKALAAKENTANKIATTDSTYFTGGKVADGALTSMVSDNTNFPTVAAAVQIADAKASEVLKKVDSNAGEMAEIASTVETLAADENTPGSVKNQVKVEADRAKGEESRIEGLVTAETQRAEGEESRIEGLLTAETQRAELAEQGLQDAIDDINDETDGVLAQAKGYTDTEVSELETKLMDETNGTVTAAIKVEADRAKLAEQGLQTAINDIIDGTDGILAQAQDYTDTEVSELETKLMDETNGTVTAAIKVEADRAKGEESRIAGLVTAEESRAMGVEQGLQNAIDTINNGTTGIYAQAKAYTDAGLTTIYSNASECIAASPSNNCILSARTGTDGKPMYVWISLTAPAE